MTEALRAVFKPELRYTNSMVDDPFKDAVAVFVYRGFIAAVFENIVSGDELHRITSAFKVTSGANTGVSLYSAYTLNTETMHQCIHYTIDQCYDLFKCTVCRLIGEGVQPVCWR